MDRYERPVGFPTVTDAVLAALAHQVWQQDRVRWAPKHLIPVGNSQAAQDAVVPLVKVPAPVALIA